MSPPRLIALCGNPLSGKSTAARILANFQYQLVDDGLPLRRIAMDYFGLSEHQVFTQSGKLESVELNGRTRQVREILGEIGNAFEEKFGEDIIPLMSISQLQPSQAYVFGSVRRNQGIFWKKHGALVIEIANPLASPSKYEFDQFNSSVVDVCIDNDGLARGLSPELALADLEQKLINAVGL